MVAKQITLRVVDQKGCTPLHYIKYDDNIIYYMAFREQYLSASDEHIDATSYPTDVNLQYWLSGEDLGSDVVDRGESHENYATIG